MNMLKKLDRLKTALENMESQIWNAKYFLKETEERLKVAYALYRELAEEINREDSSKVETH
jgi:hypothetical protein